VNGISAYATGKNKSESNIKERKGMSLPTEDGGKARRSTETVKRLKKDNQGGSLKITAHEEGGQMVLPKDQVTLFWLRRGRDLQV